MKIRGNVAITVKFPLVLHPRRIFTLYSLQIFPSIIHGSVDDHVTILEEESVALAIDHKQEYYYTLNLQQFAEFKKENFLTEN